MKLRTKILSLAMAATMLTGVVAGAASTTWVFDAYDLNHPQYLKVEKQLDEKGYPTGLWRYAGMPNSIEWKHAFYEAAYPHYEYEMLYLDGKLQSAAGARPTGAVAKSVQEVRPLYWEAYAPYAIYGQTYTSIPGILAWTPVSLNVIAPAYMGNADVKKDWVDYGFSAYRTVYGAFVDTYDFLTQEVGAGKFQFAKNYNEMVNSYNAIKALDLTGTGLDAWPAGTDFTALVPALVQEELVGPKYEGGKVVGSKAVRALDEMMVATGKGANYNPALVSSEVDYVPVSWQYGSYEEEVHHSIYEYLVIDGVVMDGGDCLELVYDPCCKAQNWYLAPAKKPLIKRYTGGVAAPYLY
ncbi:MAG: hypothetical protein IJC74_01780 [Clostridia bacterium]|nr:hypothetical protein [Clostridia bacterium]